MRIRIRETGAVVYEDEWRRLYPETSFPAVITSDILDAFGSDPVLEGSQPSLTANQYAVYNGVEQLNGQWFTKYIAVDHTADELAAQLQAWRQSASCTPFQGRMALANAGLLTTVETAIAGADQKTKVAWDYALEWKRMSPMIVTLINSLGISETQADDLFKAAQQIEA